MASPRPGVEADAARRAAGGRWSGLYVRLTFVVLVTLSIFGVAVVLLHTVALGRATAPQRLEALAFVADAVSRDPTRAITSTTFEVTVLGADGGLRLGAPLPPWLVGELPLPQGERCTLMGPCVATRPSVLLGEPVTVAAYYHPNRSFLAPFTIAFLVLVTLWIAVAATAGVWLLRALRQADEARRRLLAGLAHDLGTPLTSIRGFAETLLSSASVSEASARRGWTVVYRESLRMQRLVEDMLTLSRLEAGRLAIGSRPFDLREPLQAATERAALAYGEQPRLSLPAEPATVSGDRDRLDQVLANLVDNAYRHGKGREVELSLSAGEGMWTVEVADRGPGLDARARERLFEPFLGDSGGSGLGLTIAREVVERHGGRLAVLDREGGGCRIRLQLPATPAA